LDKGFHLASADLKPKKRFVIYPGNERFPLDADTEAIGLARADTNLALHPISRPRLKVEEQFGVPSQAESKMRQPEQTPLSINR